MGHFTEEALSKFQEMRTGGFNFGESEVYDFTRCVRPDGTAYGTDGQCKQGKEKGKSPSQAVSPKKAAALRNLEQARAKVDKIKRAMLATKDRKAKGALSMAYLGAMAAYKVAERKVGSMK